MTASESAEGFRLVTRKKRKNRRNRGWNLHHFKENQERNNIVDETIVLRRLDEIRQELQSSEYFRISSENVNKAIEASSNNKLGKLVCFGLGTFTNCRAALYQLAFILEINKILGIEDAEFYDPIFTDSDKNILNKLNCTLLKYNCEGKYSVECETLFYLPHCPKQLTNNFLWCNWDKSALAQTVLISNSFDSLRRNTFEKDLKRDAEYIVRIFEYTKEFPLIHEDKTFDCYFNDTSVHVFPETQLDLIVKDFWIDKLEPKYVEAETELIIKELNSKLSIS